MSQVKEMYKDGQFCRLKECTGTDNFTGEKNVQGQTITWNFISNLFQNIYLRSSQDLSQCLLVQIIGFWGFLDLVRPLGQD